MDNLNTVVVSRGQCPKCLDSGANNLVFYADGHAYCYSCSHLVPAKGGYTPIQEDTYTLPMHTTFSVLGKRGISEAAIKSFGVQVKQTEDGQLWLSFPLHDVNGAEYTQHLRAIDTSTGELTRIMKYPGGVKLKLPLFGWQHVKKQPTLVVCEGETDALILSSRLGHQSQVAVVGLVGVANAEKLAAHMVAYAGKRKIVLAMDNDQAGKDAVAKIVTYNDRHEANLNLLKLSIPAQHKDIGDWLTAEPTLDILSEIEQSQAVAIAGILGADEIADSLGDYIVNLRLNSLVELKFSPTLSEAVRLLPGKLVGVAGSSGQGKSTLAEHMIMEHLQQQKKTFVVSQEMMPAEVALKLARMIRNQPLDNPRFLQTLTLAEIVNVKECVRKLTRLMNATDGFGVMEVERIDQHLHKLTAAGNKPELVVVDHLLAICQNTEANSIMDVCRDLKELARNHQTCIVLLSHVRKAQNGKSKTIYRPQLDDIYGSSGLAMYADSILAVASDKSKCETYIETIKVERLGGAYRDVSFSYKDYCLCELDNSGHTDYAEEEEYDSQEEVY